MDPWGRFRPCFGGLEPPRSRQATRGDPPAALVPLGREVWHTCSAGLRAGRVGGWHLRTWPTWPRVWLEILREQRPRPFYAPSSSAGPPERERASALGDAATRREWCRGLAPYAAVAFPGPRQVPIGSSMPVIYLHRAVIITHMFRPEQVRLPC